MKYLFLLRPDVILLGSGLPILAGFFSGTFELFTALLLILLTSIGLHTASNFVGEYYDVDVDRINRKTYSKDYERFVKSYALILGAAIFIICLSLLYYIFGFTVFIVGVITSIIGLLYSIPPIRLKNRGFFGTIAVTFPFVLIFIISAVAFGAHATLALIFLSTLLCFDLLASIMSKDFKDVKGDSKVGVMTPGALYDPKRLANMCLITSLIPSIVIVIAVLSSVLSITLLLAIPFLFLLRIVPLFRLYKEPVKNGNRIFKLNIAGSLIVPYLLTLFFV